MQGDLLDSLSSVSPAALTGKGSEFLGRAASRRRIQAGFFLLIGVGIFLFGRVFELQVVRAENFKKAAEANRIRTEIVVPTRGLIVDRQGRPLVRNIFHYVIGIVPADLPAGAKRAGALSDIAAKIGVDSAKLLESMSSFPASLTEPVALHENLNYEEAMRLYLSVRDIPAVRLFVQTQRDYHNETGHEIMSLGHIVGYIGRVSAPEFSKLAERSYRPSDIIGKTGIEAFYEKDLRGRPGLRTITINARGFTVAAIANEPATAGGAVALTIDRDLQAAAEQALRRGLIAVGARRGAAVALDPDNGELLALVSWPAFSATAMSQGLAPEEFEKLISNKDHPLFPRAIAGTYPSGSTIKPFIATAALQSGVISPTTRILSTGGIRVGSSFFPDWRAGGHGWVSLREAIASSVNTFFYVIGGGWPTGTSNFKFQISNSVIHPLGPEGIADALRRFGFGATTGIDIYGEAAGLVPTPAWKQQTRNEDWYIGDTYHLAIGQGDLLITPLQLARAAAVIANGGRLTSPHLLLRDDSVKEGELDESYIKFLPIIRAALRAAVTGGSAQKLAALPFFAAGKTGTAQTDNKHRPHAWFTGFAERPAIGSQQSAVSRRVAVSVLIEEGGEGSVAAVPVAEEIFRHWNGMTNAR